jgi:hypothetical protein
MIAEFTSPILRKLKNLVYVSHLDSESKIPLVEYNLKQLTPFFEKTILVYSSTDPKNIFLKNGFCGLSADDINLIPNEGYDAGKYKFGLSKIDCSDGHYTALINDSVSIINSLTYIFLRLDSLLNQGFDYIGFLESEEYKRHYQSWFTVVNNKSADYYTTNVNTNLNKKRDVIHHNEVALSNQMIYNFNSCSLFKHTTNIFYKQPDVFLKYVLAGFPFVKNNAFDSRFLENEKLKFNESLKDPNYVNKTLYNLIQTYYKQLA